MARERTKAANRAEDFLSLVEREHIISVLERVPKVEDAAALLGIDASTLWRKRKKYEGT